MPTPHSWSRKVALLCLLLPALSQAQVPVHDQAYKWKNVAIVAGGFVSGILFHPAQKNLIYARTDIGGAYRWDARAKRWTPLLDWLTAPDWNLYGIESIGLDPSDPKRLYLACGTYTNEWAGNGVILRSDDQGRTFQRTDLPFKNGGNMPGRSIGERLAVDPNDGNTLYFGTRNNGLWKSTDRAVTWHRVDSFPEEGQAGTGIGVVVFDPRSGSRGIASKVAYVFASDRQGGIYKTEDAGTTWSKVVGQPDGLFAHQAVLSKNGILTITFVNAPGPNDISNGAVYAFNTGDGSWAAITPDKKGGFGYSGLSVNPRNPRDLVVSTLDRWSAGDDVFRSHDGGQTWTAMREKSTRDASLAPYMTWGAKESSFGWWIGALAMDPFNPAHLEYGTGANIWATSDGDQPATHWAVGGLGIEETADIDLLSPATGPHLITALGDIGGFTHEDLDSPPPGGMTLNPMFGNTDSLDYAEFSPEKIVRVGRPDKGQKPGAYSTDAGRTWTPFRSIPGAGRGSGSVAITADGKHVIWAPSGSSPWVADFPDGTWVKSDGAPNGAKVVADRISPNIVYALAGETLHLSSDAGLHFAPVQRGLSTHHGEMRTEPGFSGHLWLPTDEGLMVSRDEGKTFIKLPGVGRAQGVGFGKAAPGHAHPAVFLNGQINGLFGVFRSDDEGQSWVRITDAKHEYGTRGIVIGDPRIYGRVYLGTNGRGVLYADPAR